MTLYVLFTSEDAVSRYNAAIAAVRLVALVPRELRPRIITAGPNIVLTVTAPADGTAADAIAAVRLAVCDPVLARWRLALYSESPLDRNEGDEE